MAFGLFMKSRQKANIVTLYMFRYGGGSAFYAVTDCERPITYANVDFMPVAIKHGDIVASGSLDNSTLEVTTHRRTPPAQMFTSYPPSTVITLDILKMHRDDPDQQVMRVWFGEIKSAKFEKSEIKFSCEPAGTRTMTPGIRRHYQIGCPHILFGPMCRVQKSAWVQQAIVSSIVKSTLTLVDGWNGRGIAASHYLNGYIEWIGSPGVAHDARSLIKVIDGNTFKMGGVPLNAEPGAQLNIYPGCNRQKSHCGGVYSNIANFGGFPSIPFSNPGGLVDNYH